MVGKKECGKTCFLQNLALNNFSGKLVTTEWVTGIGIGHQREAEIQACFSNKVEFHLVKTSEDSELIEKYKLRTRNIVTNESNSGFKEKISLDRLIVMYSFSGIANTSKKLAKFLIVWRKYRYHCIYVFHVITPETQIWKKILSKTNIFNIFP